MTKATRWIVASLALLLASPAAIAQASVEGWYAEVGGGVSLLANTDVNRLGTTNTIESKEGFILSGAFGRQHRNVHIEVEALYFENEFNRISGGGSSAALSGDASVFGAMANVYYDFDFGGTWRPFLGGGVGLALVSFNDLTASGFFNLDDDDRTLAYQLRAGISYSLSESTELVVNYRYFLTGDLGFADSGGAAVSMDGIESHGVEARFRIRY